MDKKWLYIFALLLPVILRVLAIDTPLVESLMTLHYEAPARFFYALRLHPQFVLFVGGWPLPLFIACVVLYWLSANNENDMGVQFMLLPLIYAPFDITATFLYINDWTFSFVFPHILTIMAFGYPYIFAWTVLIWCLEKIGLAK
jgi:hypothetical protein